MAILAQGLDPRQTGDRIKGRILILGQKAFEVGSFGEGDGVIGRMAGALDFLQRLPDAACRFVDGFVENVARERTGTGGDEECAMRPQQA